MRQPDKDLSRRESFLHKMPTGGRVAEVGVETGNFSELILRALQPEELHLIDLWAPQAPQVYVDPTNQRTRARWEAMYNDVCKRFAEDSRVVIRRGYSHVEARLFPDGYFTLVYLDANHGYENVQSDLQEWWPKVRRGGFLAGHDYAPAANDGTPFGVIQAVDEFVAERGLEITYLTQGRWPSYAIEKEA